MRTANKFTNQKGQVLLLTILISVIVMTIAIAASRRTTVDLRQLNASTESNRALTAAEAGVEEVLLALKNGNTFEDCGFGGAPDCTLDFGTGFVSQVDVLTQNSLALSNVPDEQTIQVELT